MIPLPFRIGMTEVDDVLNDIARPLAEYGEDDGDGRLFWWKERTASTAYVREGTEYDSNKSSDVTENKLARECLRKKEPTSSRMQR